jgi:hypothetical protein
VRSVGGNQNEIRHRFGESPNFIDQVVGQFRQLVSTNQAENPLHIDGVDQDRWLARSRDGAARILDRSVIRDRGIRSNATYKTQHFHASHLDTRTYAPSNSEDSLAVESAQTAVSQGPMTPTDCRGGVLFLAAAPKKKGRHRMERFLWICLAGAAGTGARYLIAVSVDAQPLAYVDTYRRGRKMTSIRAIRSTT